MSKGCLYQVYSFFLLRNSKGIENSAQEASRDFRQEIVFAMNTGTTRNISFGNEFNKSF